MEKRNPLPPRVGIGAFFLRRVSSISEQDLLQYWEWCQDYKYVLTLISLYRVFRRERSHLHGRGIKLSFIVPMSTQENTVIGGPEVSLILVAANIKKGNFMNYVSLSVMVLPMSEPQSWSRRETVVQLECAVSESHVQEPLSFCLTPYISDDVPVFLYYSAVTGREPLGVTADQSCLLIILFWLPWWCLVFLFL